MVKLSPEEIQEIQELFSLVDTDGSGEIDTSELNYFMHTLGYYPTQSELQQIIQQVDIDQSGSISFEEFLQCMVQDIAPTFTKNDLLQGFKTFQESNDVKGTIRRDVLEHLLVVYAGTSQEEAIFIADMVDTDGDGLIRFEDLVDRML